jgi:uncharacterized protein (TIGR03437 family)
LPPNFLSCPAALLLIGVAAVASAQTPISSIVPFSADEGGDIPGPQFIMLRSPAGSACEARTADLADDSQPGPSWLSVSPTTCEAPTLLRITVDPSGLAAGTYSAAILSNIGDSILKNEIDLTVNAAPPKLTVAPSTLTFKGLAAGPASTQALLVTNHGGGGPLDFTAAVTAGASWLTEQAGASKTNSVVTASVDFPTLSPGVYQGNVSVASATGAADSVDVNVLALPSGPALSLSQTGSLFNLTAGAGTTDSDVISILNQGNSGMPWTAEILTGSNFFSISPASGTTVAGGASKLTIAPRTAAAPNASDLVAGDYYGLVRISAPGAANSPQYVLTVLHVTGGNQIPIVRPGGFLVIATGTAATGKLRVIASGNDAYNISLTTPDGLKWLSATPASATATASAPADITITADPSGLEPGFYPGEVNLALVSSTAPAGALASSRTVGVLLVAPPAGATGCTPSKLGMVQTGPPGNFSIPAAWPAPLAFTVVDDCANPVTNAQVIATFSNGDPPLVASLSDPALGQYTATWIPEKDGSTTITAKATAGSLSSAELRFGGDVSRNPAPLIFRNGTVHLLNPKPGAPLAPGTLIQINGSNLANSDATPTDARLPTTLNGTTVLIGPYSAPLVSLSDGTLAAQLPVELPANSQYPVVVSVNNAISAPDIVTVAPNTPGILATDDGHAVAQHPDGNPVTASAPATPGEVVSIFLSGLGATDRQVASGVPAPAIEPLARITTPTTVTLNGNPVDVGFAGLAPGQVGLYRIDLTVPPDASPGDLMLSVSQNGFTSNTVLLTVGSSQ